MKFVFATNNKNKLNEVISLVSGKYTISSLQDVNCFDEIPETSDTIEGNALQKAKYVFDNFKVNCFADDTGLETEALNNAPGVYSARYAGEHGNDEANMQKVLDNLQGVANRNARFKTVIALIIDGKEYCFEGIAEGIILKQKSGKKGFGYDPIFQPKGYNVSFAEMTAEQKNDISHRGIATRKLIDFLNTL
jgi:XTP/dITP diphosphohydrolase